MCVRAVGKSLDRRFLSFLLPPREPSTDLRPAVIATRFFDERGLSRSCATNYSVVLSLKEESCQRSQRLAADQSIDACFSFLFFLLFYRELLPASSPLPPPCSTLDLLCAKCVVNRKYTQELIVLIRSNHVYFLVRSVARLHFLHNSRSNSSSNNDAIELNIQNLHLWHCRFCNCTAFTPQFLFR